MCDWAYFIALPNKLTMTVLILSISMEILLSRVIRQLLIVEEELVYTEVQQSILIVQLFQKMKQSPVQPLVYGIMEKLL